MLRPWSPRLDTLFCERAEVIQRAIFVLSVPEDARRFLKILPDLQDLGLEEATLLHILPAGPGPAEPMPELANWVRNFETALPQVDLALKRGNAVRWISELARVRRTHVVILSTPPKGRAWDIERVSSPLRNLGIPILYLPDGPPLPSLQGDVLIAVKNEQTLETIGPELRALLDPRELQAVQIVDEGERAGVVEVGGVRLERIPSRQNVADALLEVASRRLPGLLTIMNAETDGGPGGGVPILKPVLERAKWPVLIWVAGAGP